MQSSQKSILGMLVILNLCVMAAILAIEVYKG